MSARELITEHLDLWTGAVTKKPSSGRGSNGKTELTGVKKLRELILELAVRGKLLEQNPTDEPASKLLERVRAEKLHLIKQGKIKKRRKLPELTEMTKPFNLPSSWEWSQLEDVGRDWGQKTPKDDFSYIDVASVDSLRGEITQPSILSAEEAPSRARKIVSEGTLIYSTVRPYLQNIAVIESKIEPEPIASTAFAILHPLAGMPARFYLHYLRSPAFVRYVESVQTGIAYPAINDKQFFSGLVPVPPLEEQHRIVQKVDELMDLCDRLEQQTSDQLEAHETLVDTLLGTLTQSENATELADSWARLAAHFDTLFTTEQSIGKLKQTILQLAVMGRLVEQNVGDEPTESLLTNIDQEIASLVKQGLIKKPKPTPEISDSDKFFGIPDSWQWVRLGSLALHSEAGWSPKCHDVPRENQGWAVLKVSAVTWGEFRPSENKELPSNLTPRREYEVHPSDFLISRANTSELVARSVVVPKGAPAKLMMSDKIIRFVFSDQIEPLYINLFNNSPFARSYYLSVAGGTSSSMKNVSRAQIQALAVPLPPLGEQHRIVQKVDELMVLCDQLKERLNQAGETRCQLAEAVVEGALKE
ncbi:type I restriction-modification enzyme S subunit [Marinobacter santoriniensis NKSG1]|uniref:Type I restriction-modification enzyme S subunit n=1 Tax=Marinobacter santoriniensis NKSG1 TaxID=1288826 RepID=M7CNM5_9GAMM|nr:restriction endonuclease subunit S [Marinobacter santoriniensis]EMP55246.1 type I restriction-modification enzyme S subunit [Marinobacter santoriniensis NKSG1]